MFHLHYDTDLDRLAAALAGRLAQPVAGDVLVPQTVLVPQRGLQRWLVQRLAERHGIAANLQFLMPGQMVWRVLQANDVGLAERSTFDADLMRWRLRELLVELPHQHSELQAWTAGDLPDLARFQLATRLAQLFQRYQAYRHDLLREWERGAEPHEPQAIVWRALVAQADEAPRSHLLAEFLHAHAHASGEPLPGMPARLFVFGCIHVSPEVLRFLGILGRHGTVHFFLPTPCRQYWGDIRHRRDWRKGLCEQGGDYFDQPENPLLVSMGGVGRDFVAQVFGYDEIQPNEETDADDTPPPRDTLLQRVQADVIDMEFPQPFADYPDPGDDSLTVHACHSPLREVQVLHDALLDLFEREPDLEPRDVAVMVPNLAAYAPCVDAVFGAVPPDDTQRIPWTVADRPAASSHAIVGMFLRLLHLPATRLTLEEVLDVLEVPAVARPRGLDGDARDGLRVRLTEAGVRWGEDAHDRAAVDLPATREYSWAFGRERLLAGYLLGEEDDDADNDARVDGIAPLTDLEGASAQALGEALRVQRLLRTLRAAQRHDRAPSAWQDLLNRALDTLVPEPSGRDEERAMDLVRGALASLAGDASAADCDGPLDWRSAREFLREKLTDPPGYQRFLAGGVSVCGMIPLRNVPFRVICVLGLNARDFPRSDDGDAFNRIQADRLADRRKTGDRSTREDDRYLFLQTLMAARDRLYLSYTGMDARNGTERTASIVLEELLDTVCEGYFRKPEDARAALWVRHPLQPFSPRLFDGDDARLFTYRQAWQPKSPAGRVDGDGETFVDCVLPPADETPWRVAWTDLADLLAAPQRTFLQRQAGLGLSDAADEALDREPLQSDARTRSRACRALFEQWCADPELDPVESLERLRAQALLPPLQLGREAFQQYRADMQPQARDWLRAAAVGMRLGKVFELPLAGDVVLYGRLPDATVDGTVAGWVGSPANAERWIRWWVGLLLSSACTDGGAGMAFGASGKDMSFPCRLKLPSAEEAKTHLQTLVDGYRQGLRQPLALTARAGWQFVQAWDAAAKDPEKMRRRALDLARKQWNGTRERDRWTALALRGRDPLPEEGDTAAFEEQAHKVFGPLWRAVCEGGAS